MLNSNLKAEDFIFESTSIEISKEENIIIAKDGVSIDTEDGLEIKSDEATYYKEEKLLILNGNVIIKDNIQNIIIKSDNINYEKNLENIF